MKMNEHRAVSVFLLLLAMTINDDEPPKVFVVAPFCFALFGVRLHGVCSYFFVGIFLTNQPKCSLLLSHPPCAPIHNFFQS